MSLSGLSPVQAKVVHVQLKVHYTALAGIGGAAHLLVIAWKPWF
jgi:hypothetical protein